MNPRPLLWLVIPLGLIAGAALGLYLAWGPMASAPVAASPADLRRAEKEQYLHLVASAYAEEQDARQARLRLDSLQAGNAALWVAELAREESRLERAASAARLARLAVALAVTDPQIVALAATPTAIGAAPAVPVWTLVEQGPLRCDQFPEGRSPMLVVRALDEAASPLQGITFELAQPSGQPIRLRTDRNGQATIPFEGSWSLTLPGAPPIALSDEGLVASCATAEPDSFHAIGVTLQRR